MCLIRIFRDLISFSIYIPYFMDWNLKTKKLWLFYESNNQLRKINRIKTNVRSGENDDWTIGDGDLRVVPVHENFGHILRTSGHSGRQKGQPKYMYHHSYWKIKHFTFRIWRNIFSCCLNVRVTIVLDSECYSRFVWFDINITSLFLWNIHNRKMSHLTDRILTERTEMWLNCRYMPFCFSSSGLPKVIF